MRWFNVLYCFTNGFNSLEECENAIKAGTELDSHSKNGTNPSDEDNNARISTLKTYMAEIGKLNSNQISVMNSCVAKSLGITNKILYYIYDELKKLRFDPNQVGAYAYNLARIYKYGNEYFDINKRKNENLDPVDDEKVKEIANQFIAVTKLTGNDRTLDALARLYYSTLTYKNEFTRVTYHGVKGKSPSVFGDIAILPDIFKLILDTNIQTNTLLMQICVSMLETDRLSDKEFVERLEKCKGGFIKADLTPLKNVVVKLENEDYKDSDICSYISDLLDDDTILKNSTIGGKDIDTLLSKHKKSNLSTIMEMLVDFIMQNPNKNNVINASNYNTVVTGILAHINDIIENVYMKSMEEISNILDEYHNTLNTIVTLSVDSGYMKKFSLTDTVIRWRSFVNSPIYDGNPDQKDYDQSCNTIAQDTVQNNAANYKYTFRGKNINKVFKTFSATTSNNIMLLLKVIKFKEPLSSVYKAIIDDGNRAFINVSSKTQNFTLSYKLDADTEIQIKAMNILVKFLLDFFQNKFTTQVTLARNNANNVQNGWYSAACNLIYSKNFKVTESAEIMMYGNRQILIEDLSGDMDSYFNKLYKSIEAYKKKGGSLEDYINKKAHCDTAEIKQKEEINNDSEMSETDPVTAAMLNGAEELKQKMASCTLDGTVDIEEPKDSSSDTSATSSEKPKKKASSKKKTTTTATAKPKKTTKKKAEPQQEVPADTTAEATPES